MSYYFARNKFNLFFIGFTIISIVAMIFSTTSFYLTPRILVGMFVFPFVKAYNFAVENTIGLLTSLQQLRNLQSENQRLNSEIKQLKEQAYNVDQLKRENLELKTILNLKQGIDFPVETAQIIMKDPTNFYSLITVNKGIKYGIKPGMPVFTIVDGEKIAVGKVVETAPYYSKIMTLFDSRSSIAVKEMYSNYSGIAVGHSPETNYIEVLYFPNDPDIFYKDTFVTAGFGGVYPSGLLVGKVKDVQKLNYSLYQRIILTPVLNLSRVNYVFIILNDTSVWE